MKTVKVAHPRYRNIYHTGLNGRLHHVPLGRETNASDELIEHLRGLGATVEVVPERAGSHQEGSGREPAQSPKDTPRKAKPKTARKKAVAKKAK